MTEAYPLQWPEGKPRSKYHKSAAFSPKSFGMARDFLLLELSRLKAKNVVISSNIPLRQDGLPYAKFAIPADKGVAVYFEYEGQQMAFSCDQWDKIEHNIYAIGKTIEAIRGIERWGSGDMMRAAFQGFTALPAPMTTPVYRQWWEVLEIDRGEHPDTVKARYRTLARRYHPDNGGDADKMAQINEAYAMARMEKGF